MWNEYNSACYLIDNDIMVDFPNGACKYLYRSGKMPKDINHVLLTHFHGDHYFDIPFYILNKSKSKSHTINIYCSKDGKKKINKLGYLAFPNSFKDALKETNIDYTFNKDFAINNYKISKLLVDHGRMKPAYGYIFKTDNKIVGFTGDTTLCSNVEYMASICDMLFCDCMFKVATDKHMGINKLEHLANKYKNCKFVVSHLENDTRDILIKQKLKNVVVPKDGQIIEI